MTTELARYGDLLNEIKSCIRTAQTRRFRRLTSNCLGSIGTSDG